MTAQCPNATVISSAPSTDALNSMTCTHPTAVTCECMQAGVLRFDGITAPSDSGFTIYSQDWGESKLIPVIISILEDQGLASSISHLSQEASIPVLAVSDLRATMAGQNPKETSPEDIGRQVNQMKSNHRLLMLDKEQEEFTRVAVQFGGLANLLDRFGARVAAAAKIPRTRWLGASPIGLNSTGDSEMQNYVMMVEAERENQLPDQLEILDMIVARDAGLDEPPEYEWLSLLEMGDKDKAEVAKLKAEAVTAAINVNTMDEDDGRRVLDGDAIFGELPGPAPEPPPEPMPLPGPGGPLPPGGGGQKPPAGKAPPGKK